MPKIDCGLSNLNPGPSGCCSELSVSLTANPELPGRCRCGGTQKAIAVSHDRQATAEISTGEGDVHSLSTGTSLLPQWDSSASISPVIQAAPYWAAWVSTGVKIWQWKALPHPNLSQGCKAGKVPCPGTHSRPTQKLAMPVRGNLTFFQRHVTSSGTGSAAAWAVRGALWHFYNTSAACSYRACWRALD